MKTIKERGCCEHCGVLESGWRDYETGEFKPPKRFKVLDRETGELLEYVRLCAQCYVEFRRITPGAIIKES